MQKEGTLGNPGTHFDLLKIHKDGKEYQSQKQPSKAAASGKWKALNQFNVSREKGREQFMENDRLLDRELILIQTANF